jgi:CheY-like chemotaxis protein
MNKHVLIVEDDELLREIYATKLGMEGFTVTTACDGMDGLEKATANTPDIILLDMIMPRMTGLEFLMAYQKGGGKAKTVIMSNKSSTKEINQAKALGVLDYLIKSQLTPQDIVVRVNEYLAL